MKLRLDHDPAPRPAGGRLVSAYDLAKVAFFFFGFPRNGFGSIDVTSRCNLRCRHCYYFAQERGLSAAPSSARGPELPEDLTVEQWVSKLEEIRRTSPRWEFPFFNCSWVGGEPLIRPELIERCMGYFRYNTVVTNGTIPLPDWRVSWYVSIDGDEETHDYLRDKKGSYGRALRHVRERAQLGITIAYCISRRNAHCIEQVVRDWNAAGARHMTFDFYTPIRGIDDRELEVPPEERDRILDTLVALRRIYGDFFVTPERVFHLMRSDRCRDVTDHCLLFSKSFAFDAAGRSKGKCVMGEKADCDRCGCVVPYYLRAITDRRMILADLGRDARRLISFRNRGADRCVAV
jgi:MoaA/NifB/PqqE/SkfB family radical SAM enzyme